MEFGEAAEKGRIRLVLGARACEEEWELLGSLSRGGVKRPKDAMDPALEGNF